MERRAAVLLGLGLASIAPGAGPDAQPVRDRMTRSLRISPTMPIRVWVTIGDVTLVAWDRPDVSIEIERRVPTAAALLDMPVSISQEGHEFLVAAVARDGGHDARLRASVIIHAPAAQPFASIDVFEGRLTLRGFTGGIRARLDRGEIDAALVSGPLHLETVIGGIHVDHGGTTVTAPIRIRTFNGNIALRLPDRPTDLRLLALSLAGHVSSAIPLTLRTGFGPRFGETTLGRGEPVVSLDAVNGNVRIDTH